jgi:flagellar biosynthetic protein FliR
VELTLSYLSVGGFALALVRTTAFIVLAPPFSSPLVSFRIKAGIAAALSFLIGPKLAPNADLTNTSQFVVALLEQALVGALLGFFVWMLLAAVSSAGDLIDLTTGFSVATVLDPISARQLGPIGRLYELTVTVLLFTTGAFALIVRAFVSLGPVSLPSGESIASALVSTSARFFIAALEIAIPMLAVMLLAEVALGLLGKAAPQLSILVVGLATKALLALLLLSTTVVLLPNATRSLVSQALQSALRLFTRG